MGERHVSVGVRIAGVATSDDATDATIWAYHHHQALAVFPAYMATYRGALVSHPETVETRILPTEGGYDVSAIDFAMALKDDAVRLRLWPRARLPVTILQVTVTTTATTLTLNTIFADGTVIYMGRETIRLGTHTGSGVYTGCTRGLWRSARQPHQAGTQGFDRVPEWRGRSVELVTFASDDPSWRIRWRGLAETRKTDDLHTELKIPCVDLLGALFKARIGRTPQNLASGGELKVFPDFGTIPVLQGKVKAKRINAKPIPSGVEYTPVYVDGMPFAVPYDGASFDFDQALMLFEEDIKELDELTPGSTIRKAYEMIIVSKRHDQTLPTPISITTAMEYPYHPLSLAWTLLASTSTRPNRLVDVLEPDYLGPGYAVDAESFLDAPQWRALIAATREVELDEIILSWAGEPEDLGPLLVEKLLRPYGFYFTLTEDHLIGVQQLKPLDIEEACEAEQRAITVLSPQDGGSLLWDEDEAVRLSQLLLQIGKRPWREGVSVPVPVQSGVTLSPLLENPKVQTFDLSTLDIRRATELGQGAQSADRALWQQVYQVQLGYLGTPTLQIKAQDSKLSGLSYDLGQRYVPGPGMPQDAVLLDPDGQLLRYPLDETARVRLTGVLIGSRYHVQDSTYTLTLWLTAWADALKARWRAPAMKVTGADAINQRLLTDAASNFGLLTDDAQSFAVGDEVRLYARHGTRWLSDVNATVTAVGAQYVQLDTWYAASPVASPELILRLAPSTLYTDDSRIDCEDRPFTFQADESLEIDGPSGVEPADRYA